MHTWFLLKVQVIDLNEASNRICHSLAQHQVLFAHAEVFKWAFQAGAEVMFAGFPNKENIVEQISKMPLSADTSARRCEDLSGDVFKQLLSLPCLVDCI